MSVRLSVCLHAYSRQLSNRSEPNLEGGFLEPGNLAVIISSNALHLYPSFYLFSAHGFHSCLPSSIFWLCKSFFVTGLLAKTHGAQ